MHASALIWPLVGLALFCQPAFSRGYKEVKDVSVSCGQTMTCTLSVRSLGEGKVRGLSLERANRFYDALSIDIRSQMPMEAGTRFLITIDGRDSLSLIANAEGVRESGYVYRERNPDVIDWVVKGMKAGSVLTISQTGKGQKAKGKFSLSGSVAGMIWMDEYQDLLDTEYALHVKGNYAPNDRVPIQAIDGRQDLPPDLWNIYYANEDKACGFMEGSDERLTYGDAFRFDLEGIVLYGLPCGMGGAYNQPYAFFYTDSEGGPVQEVAFLLDGNKVNDSEMPEIWNMSFNPRFLQLTSYFKGRGLGDCGTQSKWSLIYHQGVAFFEAQEIREKGDCDGNYAGGPDNWPLSWPVN